MNISQAAKHSGIPPKTIRYYESIGLLPPQVRSENGYRVYSESDITTLRFIQRARGLGFAVKEVEALLALWRDTERASADVRAVAQRHIGEIDHKIAELQTMRATLQHLVNRCHGDDRPDCPILDGLAAGDDTDSCCSPPKDAL